MTNNNSVKFIYNKDKVEWGQYDDMFPTQDSNKYEEVKLDPDDSLEDYFDSFYYFLMQVGFTKRDIDSTARKYFKWNCLILLFIHHLRVIVMRPFHSKLLLLQSGLMGVVALFSILIVNLIVSGDSITPSKDNTIRLLHPPSKEIR